MALKPFAHGFTDYYNPRYPSNLLHGNIQCYTLVQKKTSNPRSEARDFKGYTKIGSETGSACGVPSRVAPSGLDLRRVRRGEVAERARAEFLVHVFARCERDRGFVED